MTKKKEMRTKDICQLFTPVQLICNKRRTENNTNNKKILPLFFFLPQKFIPANFMESLYPRNFITVKNLKIGHPES